MGLLSARFSLQGGGSKGTFAPFACKAPGEPCATAEAVGEQGRLAVFSVLSVCCHSSSLPPEVVLAVWVLLANMS